MQDHCLEERQHDSARKRPRSSLCKSSPPVCARFSLFSFFFLLFFFFFPPPFTGPPKRFGNASKQALRGENLPVCGWVPPLPSSLCVPPPPFSFPFFFYSVLQTQDHHLKAKRRELTGKRPRSSPCKSSPPVCARFSFLSFFFLLFIFFFLPPFTGSPKRFGNASKQGPDT